jgi:hypothetical protein
MQELENPQFKPKPGMPTTNCLFFSVNAHAQKKALNDSDRLRDQPETSFCSRSNFFSSNKMVFKSPNPSNETLP